MKLIPTKYITVVTVTDPDTGEDVDVEIRKLASGPVVGIDAACLESLGGLDPERHFPLNPYAVGEGLLIPDDESGLITTAKLPPDVVKEAKQFAQNIDFIHHPNPERKP